MATSAPLVPTETTGVQDSRRNAALVIAGTCVLLPIAGASAGVWLWLFFRHRMSWRWPAVTAVALTGVLWLTGFFTAAGLVRFVEPWRGALEAITSDDSFVAYLASGWGSWIAAQGVASVWLGTVVAGVVCALAWRRRPKWEHRSIVVTWWLRRKVVKTSRMIGAGMKSPSEGITVGISTDTRDGRFAGGEPPVAYGERVALSNAEIAGHVLVVGSTGSGKTTTMLVGARDVIRQGHGCVFIDCKGGPDVPAQLAEWAERYGRRFFHWMIHEPGTYSGPSSLGPAFYDPIGRGDASRRKDLLVGSHKWDVEYYKSVVGEYLQTAFQLGDILWPGDAHATELRNRWVLAHEGGTPRGSSFERAMQLLDPEQIRDAAEFLAAQQVEMHGVDMDEFVSHLRLVAPPPGSQEWSGVRNMRARLHTLTASTAGAWLRTVDDPDAAHINLMETAREGDVVCFSLDTSNYQETAALVAGLIIQDLKTLSSEIRYNANQLDPLHVYVDEFSAVESTNILGLLSKARDARIPVTLATQALADLARDEATFVDQVLGILGSFIIHRANQESDARVFSGLTGLTTRTVTRQTLNVNPGLGVGLGTATATGSAFVHEQQGYVVEPDMFQNLGEGQCVVVTKIGTIRYIAPVQVIRENPLWASRMADGPLEGPAWGKWVDSETRRHWPHAKTDDLVAGPGGITGGEVAPAGASGSVPKRPNKVGVEAIEDVLSVLDAQPPSTPKRPTRPPGLG